MLRDRASGLVSMLENRTLSAYWQSRAPHVLRALAISPTDRVLEVGYGAGLWTSYLAPRAGEYTALEIDPAAIDKARAWRSPTTPVRPVEGVRFVVGDAQSLPFADQSFDVVLMIDVIEHLADDRLALREVARVLAPGGRFVLTTLREDRPSYLHRLEFHEHAREYDSERLRALCAAAGLSVREAFDFYRAPMMLARELAVAVEHRLPFARWPVSVTLLPLFALERAFPVGRPGGIGVSSVRSPSD